MTAAYDTYDYPKYWKERKYEHESEVIAIREFLSRLPKLKHLADIGCGFGRLAPAYRDHAKKITMIDPSSKLLKLAKNSCGNEDISYTKSEIQSLDKKIKASTFGAVVVVRVMHHVEDIDTALKGLHRLLEKDGYLIIEFANKLHGKALFSNLLKGNLTFPLDIFPIDIRSKRNKKDNSIPFINYHPDQIKQAIKASGFKIKEVRSVSNFRTDFVKRNVPLKLLLFIEKYIQKPLAHIYFGPSIFVLAQKK